MAERAPAKEHDHEACVEAALHRADALCARSGTRLTALRRRVLAYVWRDHAAVKAYDILAHLADRGGPAKPPTVYRTLQFLQAQGLVHRLESLNAYVGCAHPQRRHVGQFFICAACGVVREVRLPAVEQAVAREATAQAFTVEHQTLEVHGRCAACREGSDA